MAPEEIFEHAVMPTGASSQFFIDTLTRTGIGARRFIHGERAAPRLSVATVTLASAAAPVVAQRRLPEWLVCLSSLALALARVEWACRRR
jgi:hypothetical protein